MHLSGDVKAWDGSADWTVYTGVLDPTAAYELDFDADAYGTILNSDGSTIQDYTFESGDFDPIRNQALFDLTISPYGSGSPQIVILPEPSLIQAPLAIGTLIWFGRRGKH